MKNNGKKKFLSSNIYLILPAIVILTTIITNTATAKSLYVIADILGASESRTQPVQAYDIGVDGRLTFQAQHDIPHSMLGAVGMAIDADSGYLFITYEASNVIQLLDPYTMADVGKTTAPDAHNLAGIKYDHEKSLLYCVDRRSHFLYVYNWYPETTTLTHVPGSPFTLENAHAYGIALDEIHDLLYVANASETVTVYRTSDWELIDTITLSRIAISIAVDVRNGFLYTGAGYLGNFFLTQYHLATGSEKEVQVEPDAGIMGLRVDTDTGLVYMSTGRDTVAGGDNLLVYDKALNLIDIVHAIGNPTDLVIPIRDIGYNPLNISKLVLRGANTSTGFDDMKTVEPGSTFTYGISFENNNDYAVTNVTIVDTLPDEVAFVTATNEGVNGHLDIDEQTGKQTFTWTYAELPPRTSQLLEITVQANPDIASGTIITNSVTINSNETPPTTTSVDITVASNDLNLRKWILGIPEGQIAQVDTNDIITYIIEFDNKDNGFPVTNVTIVDELPEEVTFISAGDSQYFGKYDETSHTYTWTFDSLESGAMVHLELVVSVNPGLAVGTFITNVVTINSDETTQASSSVDAMTYYKPLNITKKVVDKDGNEITRVDPGERFTYQICFDNNNNDSKVTDVSIVDQLPEELTIVMAEDGTATGKYDAKTHTYVWTHETLDSGASDCVELVVDVNENAPRGIMITNSVTIDSNETLPTTTGVDVIVTSNDLNLKKWILGMPEGQIAQVDTNDIITYIIEFDNKDNDLPVTNLIVVDELPKEVTFISAGDSQYFGKYDVKSHTYTWTFDSLEPGVMVHLELVVSVNPGLALGTIITNTVTINSDETVEASTSVNATTYYKPLNITKKAVDKDGNEITWVEPGNRFTYQICFDNNKNDSKVTEVSIVDQLPEELTFVMADNGKASGKHDSKTHTYTWTYETLDQGASDCVELIVDVNENTPYGIMITNSVTIDSNETLPATASVDVSVGEIFWEVESLSIIPNVLRRNGTSLNILAVVQLPKGITKNDIDPNNKPKLYYLDSDSDIQNFILIGEGSQTIYGTEDSPRISILFSRPELMDALYGYGAFTLRVELKLKTGRMYFGQAVIYITRFAGD